MYKPRAHDEVRGCTSLCLAGCVPKEPYDEGCFANEPHAAQGNVNPRKGVLWRG